MSREISVVRKITLTEAEEVILRDLAKSPRRGVKPEASAVTPAPSENTSKEEAA